MLIFNCMTECMTKIKKLSFTFSFSSSTTIFGFVLYPQINNNLDFFNACKTLFEVKLDSIFLLISHRLIKRVYRPQHSHLVFQNMVEFLKI